MLQYWKDGQEITYYPIYGLGRVGQVVVLAGVGFGANPDLAKFPLARYSQPHAFTIIERVEGRDGYYVVVDEVGSRTILRDETYGPSQNWLYDVNEWMTWQVEHAKEVVCRNEERIKELEGQLALLKDILIRQGIKVITKEQADTLGICT